MTRIPESSSEIRNLFRRLLSCHAAYSFFEHTILRNHTVLCQKCSQRMRLIHLHGQAHKWRCYRCRRSVSCLFDTIFYQRKAKFHRVLLALLLIYLDLKQTTICLLTNLSDDTIRYYEKISRKVYLQQQSQSTIQLGGNGIEVQIDEALVRKRKYHRSRYKKQIWIFGMIENNNRDDRKIFLQIVRDRTALTLIPIIQQHVKQGTIIVSDEWRGYRSLSELGYRHETVNHSLTFVNEETGYSTNRIEGLWSHLRRSFPTNGVRQRFLKQYIACFVMKSTGKLGFNTFLNDVTFFHSDPDSSSSDSVKEEEWRISDCISDSDSSVALLTDILDSSSDEPGRSHPRHLDKHRKYLDSESQSSIGSSEYMP